MAELIPVPGQGRAVYDAPPPPPPAPDQPQRDPLAPGGIAPEMQERMLQNAEELTRKQEQYMGAEAAAYGKLPPVPTVESGKLGKVPPPPTNDIKGDAMLWLGFATALGGIAGAMTKNSSMNALAAFSGTLDGLREGNQQKFNDNFRTWEAQAKATQENNKAEMDGYRNILERQDLDHRQRADQLEMWGAVNRNKFMIELARWYKQTGDMAGFAAALDSMRAHEEKGNSALDRLIETRARVAEARQERQQDWIEREKYRRAEGAITPEDADRRAELFLNGNPTWRQGVRVGSEGMNQVSEAIDRKMQERNYSAEDISANQQRFAGGMSGARALGTRVAIVENAIRKASSLIPAALQASESVPRMPLMSLSEAQQYAMKQTGDPKLKAFIVMNLQLSEAAALGMKPTGVLDVALQQQLFDTLSTAQGKASYRSAVQKLAEGMQREYEASKQQQSGEPLPDLSKLFGGAAQGAPSMVTPKGMGGAQVPVTNDELWKRVLGQ